MTNEVSTVINPSVRAKNFLVDGTRLAAGTGATLVIQAGAGDVTAAGGFIVSATPVILAFTAASYPLTEPTPLLWFGLSGPLVVASYCACWGVEKARPFAVKVGSKIAGRDISSDVPHIWAINVMTREIKDAARQRITQWRAKRHEQELKFS